MRSDRCPTASRPARTAIFAAAICVSLLLLPPVGGAQEAGPDPLPGDALVGMDFQDVEITTVVKFISEITGKNFLLDEKVRGKISVISPSKVTVDEAFQVFQSVLQVKGFTLVESGPVVKILPIKDVKGTSLPLESDGATRGDSYVTRILPLAHLQAETAASLFQTLISRDGLISAYAPTNSLIVVDTAANISRLGQIISDLDVEGQERTVEVIHLRHAFAEDLAEILRDAMAEDTSSKRKTSKRTSTVTSVAGQKAAARSTTRGSAPPLKIVADSRANVLIAIGSRFEIGQARALVAKLDVALPRGTGRINVYRLKHGDALEMVQVLADLIGTNVSVPRRQALPGRSVTEGGGRFGGRSSGLGGRGNQGFGGGAGGNRFGGGGLGGGIGGRSSFSGVGGSIRGGGTASAGTGGEAVEFEGDVRVTADPATNSLVISASPQDYTTLRDVIVALDIPRRQVLVEAIIFEVTLDKARDLGIELQGGTSMINGKAVGLARTSLRNLNSISQIASSGGVENLAGVSGLVSALISQQTIELADGSEIPAGIALLSALERDTDVNVLSAPTILTSDNEEAEIVVAENVPFVSSRAADQTNLANTFSQVDRRDVGITLRITPQITDGKTVRLFVFQEVSAVVPTSEAQVLQLGPTTTVRSATTTVVVGDRETVAIGGLISDRMTNDESGVPYLSDLPVFGALFEFDSKTKRKVNLIILLTPHIIEDAGELRNVSNEQRARFRNARRGRTGLPRPRRSAAKGGGVLLPAVAGTEVAP